jgi:hypothetical protein
MKLFTPKNPTAFNSSLSLLTPPVPEPLQPKVGKSRLRQVKVAIFRKKLIF